MDDEAHENSAIVESNAAENVHLPHDSMVTVRLSGPPLLTVFTESMAMSEQKENDLARDIPFDLPDLIVESKEDIQMPLSNAHSMPNTAGNGNLRLLPDPSNENLSIEADERRGSESTEDSGDGEVNWAELEKTEEQEPRDQDSEDVSRKFPSVGL